MAEFKLVSGRDSISEGQVNRLMRFLRKVLVLLICLLDLNKLFLNLKSESQFFAEFGVSEACRAHFERALRKFIAGNDMPRLNVCEELMRKDLHELVELVEIEELQFYHWMNRNYIDKKTVDKRFEYTDNAGKRVAVSLSFRDRCQVICSKIKRKDEILKFTFKFLRKKILFKYERENKKQVRNQLDLKSIFNQDVLNNNAELIRKFYSYDVSKKDLMELKKNEKIYSMLVSHFLENYITDAIENIVQFKQEGFFREELEIENFVKLFYCNQQKKALVLQDVINTFEIFHSYFIGRH